MRRSQSISLILLALGGVALLTELVEYWGIAPEYADRFLILLACPWLVYRRWGAWKSTPIRSAWIGMVPLILGVISFAPVWNLFAQVGPRTILLWWGMLSWVVMVIGYLLLNGGWVRLRVVAFPLFFVFFALPLPQRAHDWVQGQLQEKTTGLAGKTLSLLGVSVEKQGFQLHLPSGDLEVVEACSGIRSVTALLAIAALIAHLRALRLYQGIILFLLAFPIIALGNVVRIMVTGLLQEGFGPHLVQGFAHELLGIVVILVGLGLIILTSRLFTPSSCQLSVVSCQLSANTNKGKSFSSAGDPPGLVFNPHSAFRIPHWKHSAFRIGSIPQLIAGLVLLMGLVGSVLSFGAASNSQRELQEGVRLPEVPLMFNGWKGTELEIPEEVRLQLAPDRVIRRHFRNDLGQEVEAWVLFWSSTRSMRGYHHPDVCWPNHGWSLVSKEIVTLSLKESSTIPLTVRKFQKKNTEQMVCYWTQEGSRIWTEADEDQLQQVDSLALIRERLFQNRPPEKGRFAFLVAGELAGNRNYSARSVLKLTQQLAEEVYDRCPWARP